MKMKLKLRSEASCNVVTDIPMRTLLQNTHPDIKNYIRKHRINVCMEFTVYNQGLRYGFLAIQEHQDRFRKYLGDGDVLIHWMSVTSLVSGQTPLAIVNIHKGTIRFIDSETHDIDKPLKMLHLYTSLK